MCSILKDITLDARVILKGFRFSFFEVQNPKNETDETIRDETCPIQDAYYTTETEKMLEIFYFDDTETIFLRISDRIVSCEALYPNTHKSEIRLMCRL